MENYYKLLEDGVSMDVANPKGVTPLMHIAGSGDHILLEMVAGRTTHINAEDEDGNSALYFAMMANDLEAVKILYNHGARITDFIYMMAIHHKRKKISEFFDKQDSSKEIFYS